MQRNSAIDPSLFTALPPVAHPLTSGELLPETQVEDQSDLIQQSIDSILAELTPTDIMQGTTRTNIGTSLGLGIATALTVEYLRRNRRDDEPLSETTTSAQKFKPECQESESID